MIAEKTDEYNELICVLSAKAEYTPLKNIQVVFPQIGTPPLIGREKWAEEQNTQIREAMEQAYKAIFSQFSEDAEVWAYGEHRDHYRIAFRYAGVPFNLSVSTFMELDFDLGLEARELAINHLHPSAVVATLLASDGMVRMMMKIRKHSDGLYSIGLT